MRFQSHGLILIFELKATRIGDGDGDGAYCLISIETISVS